MMQSDLVDRLIPSNSLVASNSIICKERHRPGQNTFVKKQLLAGRFFQQVNTRSGRCELLLMMSNSLLTDRRCLGPAFKGLEKWEVA